MLYTNRKDDETEAEERNIRQRISQRGLGNNVRIMCLNPQTVPCFIHETNHEQHRRPDVDR